METFIQYQVPRTPTQLHPTPYSGTGISTPKSPAVVGGQHFVTMYQDGMSNGYNQIENQVVPYPNLENNHGNQNSHNPHQTPNTHHTHHDGPTGSPQTDVNNNNVEGPASCSSIPTRIITTVSTLIPNIAEPQQTNHSSEPQTSGVPVVPMTTVQNSSNGYHGNIPIAALHNMAVPASPGFFTTNGTCK